MCRSMAASKRLQAERRRSSAPNGAITPTNGMGPRGVAVILSDSDEDNALTSAKAGEAPLGDVVLALPRLEVTDK